jgi:signal transduction histidine kinase
MQELASMKTDFVSVVSHELRTPLTSIIGSLATLARPELPRDSDMARDLLDSARSQANRLKYLIEDLLIVSRIEGKALPTVSETIDLVPFLEDAVREVPESGRVVVTGPTLMLTSDPEHIRRIMINLVQNAVLYAPGSPIEVVTNDELDAVTISVVDHGPGIPVEDRERVFERFTQLEPATTRRQGGTGLGLAIVRGLTSTLGGTVRVRETPEGGATFEVRLPKVPPTSSAPRRAWVDQSSGGTATAIE